MIRIALALGCLLLPIVPCFAQEGAKESKAAPVERHKNQVSDAAKAAFDRMDKVLYRPVAAGLKDLEGTLTMKMDMPGMEGMQGMPDMSCTYTVTFQAPSALKVQIAKGGEGPMAMMAGGMKRAAESLMRVSLGLHPTDEDEFDADAKSVDKKTSLTIVRYEKNVETSRQEMTLDDLGRIESVSTTMKGGADGRPAMGGPGGEQTAKTQYTWAKEGDRWIVEKLASSSGPMNFEIVPTFVDAGGFKLIQSFAMKGEGQMEMNFGFSFTDLTVNGKKIEAAGTPAAKPAASSKSK